MTVMMNYDVFVVCQPEQEYTSNERNAIRTYVKSGGGLTVFREWSLCEICGNLDFTNSIFGMFGIVFDSDTVEDSENNFREKDGWPVIIDFVNHPVTQGLEGIVYTAGCSLSVEKPAVSLAFGNSTSKTVEKKGKDIVVLACSGSGNGRVLAIGNSSFLYGPYSCGSFTHSDYISWMDNRQLGLNMFKWASGEFQDSDNDGIIDSLDGCYSPGCQIVDSKGCPEDSDEDGANDCDDECPQLRGTSDNKGCPVVDRDNDGVPDDKDTCYNPECASVNMQGCSLDSDSDGLDNFEDMLHGFSGYGSYSHK